MRHRKSRTRTTPRTVCFRSCLTGAAHRGDLKAVKEILQHSRSASMKYVSDTTITRTDAVNQVFLLCHDLQRKSGWESGAKPAVKKRKRPVSTLESDSQLAARQTKALNIVKFLVRKFRASIRSMTSRHAFAHALRRGNEQPRLADICWRSSKSTSTGMSAFRNNVKASVKMRMRTLMMTNSRQPLRSGLHSTTNTGLVFREVQLPWPCAMVPRRV